MSARPLGARILGPHDRAAEQNRAALNAAGIFAINLIAPAGAGKTSLVRRTIAALGRAARVGVASTPCGVPHHEAVATVTIEHDDAPHFSPAMLARAIRSLESANLDLLVVKNVADFVCPATYRLGSHLNVRIVTVLEHDARPRDQPQLFDGLDGLIVNMIDRLGETPFDVDRFRRGLDLLNPNLLVLPVSCRSGDGIDAWVEWLIRRRAMQFYPSHRGASPDGP